MDLQALYRASRRKNVDLTADLRLLGENDRVLDRGSARLSDISAGGAMLEGVSIDKSEYPSEPFRIEVRLTDGPYRGVGFICAPIRFVPGCDGIGVRFEETFLSVQ